MDEKRRQTTLTPAMEQHYRNGLRRYRANILARRLTLGIMEPVGRVFVVLAWLAKALGLKEVET